MNLERVASLLASNITPAQVSSIIGCSPGRLSQIMKEESFKLILADKKESLFKEDVEEQTLTDKYSAAEHVMIDRIIEMTPSAEMRDLTQALRVIGDRQEKMKTRIAPPAATNNQTLISITIPAHALAIPVLQLSSINEVVAIGDRALAPMTSTAVTNLFASMKGDNHVPSPSITSSEEIPSSTIPHEESFSHEESFLAFADLGIA